MKCNEFNKGDTVQYNGGFTANATVLEVGEWSSGEWSSGEWSSGEWSSGGIRLDLKWIDGPSKGKTEYLGTCFLTVIEKAKPVEPPATVKSAIEAKAELEKKILEQIQEYNKTYGVVVSDINLRSYAVTYNGDFGSRIYSVEIEVKL